MYRELLKLGDFCVGGKGPQNNGVESATGAHTWPQRPGLAGCLLEGRLQRLAGAPPNYRGSLVAVSYCPRCPQQR